MNKKMRKYAKLLLQAVKLEDKKYLYVDIPSFLGEFIELLKEEAEKYDLNGIYFDVSEPFKKHDLMLNLDQENINKHPMFDKSILNKYAKLDAAFLFIVSSVPDLMNDIDPKKLKDTQKHIRGTQKYFRDLYESDKLNWCIAGVPNEYWAKNGLNMSLNELWELIFKVCLVDDDKDPYENWKIKLNGLEEKTKKLNDFNFEYLKYSNSLGTDLTIYLPEDHIWSSGFGTHGEICNLPTEEIFTSPQYEKVEGIVYSSKPLLYNNILIEDFYFKFKDGKVVEYDAKVGKEVLETILTADEYSSYLGECALVSYDSPINNTGIIFRDTLYDENASCHLALGRGFVECIKNGSEMDETEIRKSGVNISMTHVDFMIGTDDLSIIGVTKDGREVEIMKDGNLII